MNKPKGTRDYYGKDQELREYIKSTIQTVSTINNFKQIETPIFESAEVFTKAIGETTDIVSKEMFVFNDKKDRTMVLRPEGTAAVIRAAVENKLLSGALPVKLSYYGPMFRYERPQKGRQRQFTQFGVETFSEKNPYIDAETILFAKTILDSLEIEYELVINSLGDKETRVKYSDALKKYFEEYKTELSDLSISRLKSNPLRILDDKIDGKKEFVKNAPKINEFYNDETKAYFEKITSFLEGMDIEFTVDPTLVRGLDYYSDTAFEFVSSSEKSGSQSTLIGGGRYDNLVKNFGGPDVSGVGFAIGIERLMIELSDLDAREPQVDVYVMNISEEAQVANMAVIYMLRKAGFITEWNYKPTKINKAFVKADKSGATVKVITGAKELAEGKVMVKVGSDQKEIKLEDLVEYIDGKVE